LLSVNIIVKRRGMPALGELVICKVTKVNPNSCDCLLEEYAKEGHVHISEISSGWVRDIRSFVRVGQSVVAKVMRIEDRVISLSLKRVDQKQENDKIKEYKLNQRAEKLLELAAKKLSKTLEQAYEEVGYTLQEKFPSMYDGFKEAINNPDMLKRRGVPEKWVAAIKEIAEKSIEQKEFEFSANLQLRTNKPNGVLIIKELLKSLEKQGLEVRYIAAPNYLVKHKTIYAKRGQKELEDKLAALPKKDVEISYQVVS
jgi:translation initiation factor 2 subunit 1